MAEWAEGEINIRFWGEHLSDTEVHFQRGLFSLRLIGQQSFALFCESNCGTDGAAAPGRERWAVLPAGHVAPGVEMRLEAGRFFRTGLCFLSAFSEHTTGVVWPYGWYATNHGASGNTSVGPVAEQREQWVCDGP